MYVPNHSCSFSHGLDWRSIVLSGGCGPQQGDRSPDANASGGGNPPTSSPDAAGVPSAPAANPEIEQALAGLSSEDRALAARQRVCPVSQKPLGSMGTPVKVRVGERDVLLCCEGCEEELKAKPEQYLAKLPNVTSGGQPPGEKINMLSDDHDLTRPSSRDGAPRPDDEGGLRAPPELHGWRKWWWWFDFIILVKLARLRFIAILRGDRRRDHAMGHAGRLLREMDAAGGRAGRGEQRTSNTSARCTPRSSATTPKTNAPSASCRCRNARRATAEAEVLPAGSSTACSCRRTESCWPACRRGQSIICRSPSRSRRSAIIEFNERAAEDRFRPVNGRIDQLLVSETGQMVEEGDVLASLYSPDLVVTVQNLLDAKQSGNKSAVGSQSHATATAGHQ